MVYEAEKIWLILEAINYEIPKSSSSKSKPPLCSKNPHFKCLSWIIGNEKPLRIALYCKLSTLLFPSVLPRVFVLDKMTKIVLIPNKFWHLPLQCSHQTKLIVEMSWTSAKFLEATPNHWWQELPNSGGHWYRRKFVSE